MNWDCIVSIQEVVRDFSHIEETVKKHGQAIIISENKPKYIVRAFDASLIDEPYSQKEEIQGLLKGVGMRVFVTYYMNFKNNDDPFSFLSEEGFSDHSVRSRMSKARAIFNNNWQKDALSIIINANRADNETKNMAGIILKNENQGGNNNV